ncbi:hypothetical protein Ptr902_07824 [Pyrenophora tritici-repentis]|nr:hypothetical protein Ptr902_07824 [Pyrenophora tritici-repentis]
MHFTVVALLAILAPFTAAQRSRFLPAGCKVLGPDCPSRQTSCTWYCGDPKEVFKNAATNVGVCYNYGPAGRAKTGKTSYCGTQ